VSDLNGKDSVTVQGVNLQLFIV